VGDLRAHGPSVNADVIDLAEQGRRNALFVLDILVRAYVPKNTNDWREGLAALQVLQEPRARGVDVWRDPDTGRTTPKPQPCSAEEAARALGIDGTPGDQQ
jgi:hypothetical protein